MTAHFRMNRLLFCAGAALLLGTLTFAQTERPITATPIESAQPRWVTGSALDWGLSESDWRRYQTLMKGEAGVHYAHLEPQFVLGLYARDEAERTRMAQAVYDQEHARMQKLLDFNRAYAKIAMADSKPVFDDALSAQFDALVNSHLASQNLNKMPTDISQRFDTKRWVLVVEPGCANCDAKMKELIKAESSVDVYVLNTDTKGIQTWANQVAIPQDAVQHGQITLNADERNWFEGVTELPVLFKSSGGR